MVMGGISCSTFLAIRLSATNCFKCCASIFSVIAGTTLLSSLKRLGPSISRYKMIDFQCPPILFMAYVMGQYISGFACICLQLMAYSCIVYLLFNFSFHILNF